jgi:hypothetical protein
MEPRRNCWLMTRGRQRLHWLPIKGVTPPQAADSRTVTRPPTADAGAQGAVGDVRTSASPRVIDVDPLSVMPGGMEEDLVKDWA